MPLDVRRISLVALLVIVGAGLVFVLLRHSGAMFTSKVPHERLPSGSARDFTDGNGIYFWNDGKYTILVWKKKLFTPGQPPDEREINKASQSAIQVKKGVRFFSYGLELSKWWVVPPYAMSFCVISDPRTVEGVFPIRIKLVDKEVPIYELVPPPRIMARLTPDLPWAINYPIRLQRRLGVQVRFVIFGATVARMSEAISGSFLPAHPACRCAHAGFDVAGRILLTDRPNYDSAQPCSSPAQIAQPQSGA